MNSSQVGFRDKAQGKGRLIRVKRGWAQFLCIILPALLWLAVPAEAVLTARQYNTGYNGGILRLENEESFVRGYLGKPDRRVNYETLETVVDIYNVMGHDSVTHLFVEYNNQSELGLVGVIYHSGSSFRDKLKTELDQDDNVEFVGKKRDVRVYRSKIGLREGQEGRVILRRKPGETYVILDDIDGKTVLVTTDMPQWEKALQ